MLESTAHERRSPIDDIRFENRRLCGLSSENPWKRRLWKLPTSTEGSTTVRVVHLGL